jgi:hypothetical protein
MARIDIDLASVPPQTGFTPLPAGTYLAIAVESEIKPTRTGGEMAVFRMQVVEGQYKDRTVFARFNIRNASATAENIGRGQLAAFCTAAGIIELTDTDELLNKPVRMKVKIRTQEGYDPSNEVAGFEASGAPVTTPAAPAPRPTAPGASKPWQRAA